MRTFARYFGRFRKHWPGVLSHYAAGIVLGFLGGHLGTSLLVVCIGYQIGQGQWKEDTPAMDCLDYGVGYVIGYLVRELC